MKRKSAKSSRRQNAPQIHAVEPKEPVEQKPFSEEKAETEIERSLRRGKTFLSGAFFVLRIIACAACGYGLFIGMACILMPYLITMVAAATGLTYDSPAADLILIMGPAMVLLGLACFYLWKGILVWLYQKLKKLSEKLVYIS